MTVFPERRETDKESPTLTPAFCLEGLSEVQGREGDLQQSTRVMLNGEDRNKNSGEKK